MGNLCLSLGLLKGEFHHHERNLRGQRTACLRQLSPKISSEAPSLNASRAWGQLTLDKPRVFWPHTLDPEVEEEAGERGKEGIKVLVACGAGKLSIVGLLSTRQAMH